MEIVRLVLNSILLMMIIQISVPAHAGELPSILIVAPEGMIFDQAIEGMTSELGGSFDVTTIKVDSGFTAVDLEKKVASSAPRVVTLMGNRTIRIYKEFIAGYQNQKTDVPVVTLIASQIEMAVNGIPDVRGISYETPMVTALVNFRSVTGKPVSKVGVIYRSVFASFIEKQTGYCQREKIDIRRILIGNDPKTHKAGIEKALHQLIKKDKIEAFWVPNDNVLLTPELLMDVWIPMFARYNIPVIVGVESLVKPELNFGTYAVIPDPQALGEQAAQIIFDLEATGWQAGQGVIYPAISVYSVLNMKKAKALSKTSKFNLNEVSKIFEEKK